jgi:hypothetical protein
MITPDMSNTPPAWVVNAALPPVLDWKNHHIGSAPSALDSV